MATPDSFLMGLVSGGYAAVTFFFMLSGFILAYAHAGKTERVGCNVKATTFWRLRFARIAPAYYLALLIALPIAMQTFAEAEAPVWSRFVGLSSVMLFLQAWWPPYAALWNYPAWSLSVECLFYALFPWLVRASARWSITALLATTYVLIVLVTVCQTELLTVGGLFPETRPEHLVLRSFFPILHLPQFVFGMALGRLYLFGPTVSPRLHAAMLGVGLCVLLLVFAAHGCCRSGHAAAQRSLIFALIIFGGAGPQRPPRRSLSRSLFYSVKQAILSTSSTSPWAIAGTRSPKGCWAQPARVVGFFLYFGFVVVVSVLVFRHFETPCDDGLPVTTPAIGANPRPSCVLAQSIAAAA